MIHSFANQGSGQAAITTEALTHRRVFASRAIGDWNSVVLQTQGSVSHPAAFSVGRSNPDLNAGLAVVDLQSPLGLEVGDVAVSDYRLLEWVDYNQVAFAKNQFGLYPEQVSGGSYKNCDRKVKHEATGSAWIKNRLGQKQDVQDDCETSPDQIALRAKNCIHASIIAGVTAVGKGK